MSVQPARRVAYDVLCAVREGDAYSNLLLPARIARASLGTADASLATELTYGTLRMRGYYDRVIALAAGRDVLKIDPPILDVLRLAVHQLLGMRVPAHAAVDEAVSLARSVGSRSATGFCNAVLRTVTRSSAQEWRSRVLEKASGADDALAARYSHPVWIIRAFRRALAAEGREDELTALLEADNAAPQVNLAVLPGLAAPDAGWEPDRYSPVGYRLPGGDPSALVAGGGVRVQDEGSQLAALALTRARPIAAGETWWDMCSAPGGKAALLAAEAAPAGAELLATEAVPARAALVRRALAAIPGTHDVRVGDARDDPGRQFDRILLDAPCTGLGALRRRPEARWRKSPGDVASLSRLQAELLDRAVRSLRPGGLLAYVTCSPHPGETRVQVTEALERWNGQLGSLDTPAILQTVATHPLDLPDAGERSSAQLWPHRHGTDAMFIALLAKAPEGTPAAP